MLNFSNNNFKGLIFTLLISLLFWIIIYNINKKIFFILIILALAWIITKLLKLLINEELRQKK